MAFAQSRTWASKKLQRFPLRTVVAALAVAGCGAFTGCGDFFVYPGSTSSSGSTSGGADLAYVSNSASGSTYLNGYVVSSGTLVAATGSPYPLGFSPAAMVVSEDDDFLYIATDSALAAGAIYGYSIGAGGALNILDSGAALVSESVASLAVSPDGQWLFALDADGITLEEYAINNSTGALTFENTYGVAGAANGIVTPVSVKVAPSGDFIVCALGTGGLITFPFNTTTGAAGPGDSLVSPGSASDGYYAIAIDGNNNIYAAGTAGTVGLQVFTSTTAGVPTLVKGTAYTTGSGPRSMVLNSGYNYVYTGDQADGTITEDSIETGPVLTAIQGSPLTAPTTVSALGLDNSDKYILAAGFNATSGIQLYTIGATGALTESGSAPTGTNLAIPTVVAMSH